MGHSLVERSQQGIVVGDADCIPRNRVGTIADVRHAQIGIAASAGVVEFVVSNLIAVAIDLRIRTTGIKRRAWSSNLRLVERYRNGLMRRVVAGIAQRR